MRAAFLFAATSVLVAGCGSCSRKEETPSADAAPVATTIPDAAPLNVTTIPIAQVQKAVNPEKLPAYVGPTGSVEGTIRVDGARAKSLGLSPATYTQCPAAEAFYGREFREGEPPPDKPDGPRWLADAIAIVTGYSGFFVPETKEARLVTIEGCGYATRTVTMTYGQRLEVQNKTKEFWTPDLVPRDPGALMMATPGGDPTKLYPKHPGRYQLVDHDRKYVVDDLFVLQYPLHAVSDGAGKFRIDGIPVGKRKLTVTHPAIADVIAQREIDVRDGVVTPVELMLHNKESAGPKDAGDDSGWVPVPGLH
ncbi:MAG: carboxypeptidase regulatory-like domain-containing protein [Labilithrix sp.]|nr:carboxypeptidase regulatory-like domain-containing protein [Labilithrix sp.]MCW5816831.1 carboxypeptidase regulatory-like domain-containing protein [Labilithrix sp.]